MSIFKIIVRRKKGVVLLVNKWDAVSKETNTARDVETKIRKKLSPFNDVPIVFVSALEKTHIFKAVEKAIEVYENRQQKIKTSVLNDLMLEAIERYPPPAYRGKFIKIKYITQLPTYHPAFAFFCNYPDLIRDDYKSFLENQLRKHFPLSGVPITIYFRNK